MSHDGTNLAIPGFMVGSYRTQKAIERGVEKNLLFKTWGGLGDQICAEPTIRYAIKAFKDCTVSLASEHPELFAHLPLKKVYDLKEYQPLWYKYFVFDTIVPPSHMMWEYVNHMLTNCVDFPSLCALRCQLPVSDKQIIMHPKAPKELELHQAVNFNKSVFVHPGRHWQSKTFPKDWWDAVLTGLFNEAVIPIVIGANTDDNRGTVDVNTINCVDLRNKLSITDCTWLLQRATVLITNDSAPLHMAASGDAWIGFIATCKHPDLISHWRNGQWSWREKNLGKGGLWDVVSHCPNKNEEVTAEKVDEELLRSWLPEPEEVVSWTLEKLSAND